MTENLSEKKHIKRGEVYWINIFNRGGSVQMGRRLVLIVQNDRGNSCSPSTIVIPFTTKLGKKMLPTHLFFRDELPRPSILLCEQIMTIDTECIRSTPVARLDDELMRRVDQTIKISLGIEG